MTGEDWNRYFKETYGDENVSWITKPGVNLNNLKDLIKNGQVSGNNIISKIDDNTQILFRRDTGSNAHPIKPDYPDPVDHYNIEIQIKNSNGKWKSTSSYHIIVDKNGNIIGRK